MTLIRSIHRFFRARSAEARPPVTLRAQSGHNIDDAPEMLDDTWDDDWEIGAADGQSFYIDYVDATGTATGRVIVVHDIREGADLSPVLHCYCTLRRAARTFRVDRIRLIADLDGVVAPSPARFLADALGMSPAVANLVATDTAHYNAAASRRKALTTPIQHQTRLLAALSHSDGAMLAVEVDEILKYLDGELVDLQPTGDDHAVLEKYIRRMRMTERAIDKALTEIGYMPPADQRRFLNAAVKVINADGALHPEEIAMINEFATDLTGAPIT